jgi:hypothetical protein
VACAPDCGEDEVCQAGGVVDDDGAEADVDWGRAGGEEGVEVARWCVGGFGEGREADDVDVGGPVEGFGEEGGGPEVLRISIDIDFGESMGG